jgi:hypothetical protein
LSLDTFIWQTLTGTFFFSYAIAGLVLSTVRHQFRRRRAARDRGPGTGSSESTLAR